MKPSQHTVENQDINQSQYLLIDKMLTYVEKFYPIENNPALLEYWYSSRDGLCNGLSILYAYTNALSEQPQNFDKEGNPITRDDYHWFLDTTKTLLTWDGQSPLPEAQMKEIDRLIQLARFFQMPSEMTQLPYSQVNVSEIIGTDTSCGQFVKKGNLSGIFTAEKLADVFNEVVNEHEPIIIRTRTHFTSILKKNDKYYFYDPNSSKGEIAYDTPQELANAFFKANSRTEFCEVGISVMQYSKEPNNLNITQTDYTSLLTRTHADVSSTYRKGSTTHGVEIAAMSNDVEGIERYLNNTFEFKDDQQSPSELANSAFLMALLTHNFDVTQHLLNGKYGHDIKSKLKEHFESSLQQRNINPSITIDFFTKNGIDIHSSLDHSGTTALISAVKANNIQMIEALIKLVDINQLDDNGMSALNYANLEENPVMIDILIKHGAVASTLNYHEKEEYKKNKQTEKLQAALDSHDWSLAKELLDLGFFAGHIVLKSQLADTEIIESLVKNHFDLEANAKKIQPYFSELLQTAINDFKWKRAKAVINLVESAKNIIIQPYIHDPQLIAQLLEKDLDLNKNKSHLYQFIEAAIRLNNEELLEKILKFDKDILNRPDENGNVPLSFALLHSNQSMLNTLLEKGADLNLVIPSIRDNNMCLSRKDMEEEGLIPFIQGAAYFDETKQAKRFVTNLLLRGFEIDEKDREGTTLLHRAVSTQNHQLVKFLIKKGANPNSTNTQGQSPLSIAKETGDPSLIQILENKSLLKSAFFDKSSLHPESKVPSATHLTVEPGRSHSSS